MKVAVCPGMVFLERIKVRPFISGGIKLKEAAEKLFKALFRGIGLSAI